MRKKKRRGPAERYTSTSARRAQHPVPSSGTASPCYKLNASKLGSAWCRGPVKVLDAPDPRGGAGLNLTLFILHNFMPRYHAMFAVT
jgi:hypothetical protein